MSQVFRYIWWLIHIEKLHHWIFNVLKNTFLHKNYTTPTCLLLKCWNDVVAQNSLKAFTINGRDAGATGSIFFKQNNLVKFSSNICAYICLWHGHFNFLYNWFMNKQYLHVQQTVMLYLNDWLKILLKNYSVETQIFWKNNKTFNISKAIIHIC